MQELSERDAASRGALLGAGAVEPLVRLLRDGAEPTPSHAAAAPVRLASEAVDERVGVTRRLVELLGSEQPPLRKRAAAAVRKIGKAHERTIAMQLSVAAMGGIEHLVGLLTHGPPEAQEYVLWLLWHATDAPSRRAVALARCVDPLMAAFLRGMRTGDVEPPAGYTTDDFKIETVRTLAETFPDHVLDLEIKVPLDDDGENDIAYAIEAARVLAAAIEELDRTDSVIVTSFSSDVMIAFREFAPEVATSPGEDEMVAWYLGAGEIAEQDVLAQLPPERIGIDILDPELIARIQAEGIGLWIWPNSDDQENEAFYRSLFELGIDGVIAGVPAEGVAAALG